MELTSRDIEDLFKILTSIATSLESISNSQGEIAAMTEKLVVERGFAL